jgi:hypothetical protein
MRSVDPGDIFPWPQYKEGYHLVMVTNIHVNMEGNVGKYAGGGSVTA